MACMYQQWGNRWDQCLLGKSYLQQGRQVDRLLDKEFHQYLVALP